MQTSIIAHPTRPVEGPSLTLVVGTPTRMPTTRSWLVVTNRRAHMQHEHVFAALRDIACTGGTTKPPGAANVSERNTAAHGKPSLAMPGPSAGSNAPPLLDRLCHRNVAPR